MTQTPSTGAYLLRWRGDMLTVTLQLDAPRAGRAAFRTNLGHARVHRREIIAETERGEVPQERAWTDVPMTEVSPGLFKVELVLGEVGVFSGKALFIPEGDHVPEWPDGANLQIKVESAEVRWNNSIYTVFPRQFGSFREIVRRLPLIMDEMGFRIIQTLPPFPVPTTYAVMGKQGSPFASTDFFSVDPSLAEFDEYATPLDQFCELIDAVHARRALFLLDLPANHTGWASALQTHHPAWFHRAPDGRFISPGAWGVTWADLVELDYARNELRAYMADVFLFWCRQGVDGFRCDAGYKIPRKTWTYIVARVREEFPDTVFMLEGLGGELSVTDELLASSDLDWAYSEIFQTYDRRGFEWYLPQAIARAEKFGALVHFAETHDNDRLAKKGVTYARLRVQLAALLSWQGAWGIANGVEWYATEKIDVHDSNDLNWGAKPNMISLIARLNAILENCPDFEGNSHLEVITCGGGNTLAVLRNAHVLVLANLDCENAVDISWDRAKFAFASVRDLLTDEAFHLTEATFHLEPGEVRCLAADAAAAVKLLPMDERTQAIRSHYDRLLIRQIKGHLFHWTYPRDLRRTVCVPEDQVVEIRADRAFRFHLVDPATGRTLRAERSHDNATRILVPHYKGDGTQCRKLEMHLVVYDHDGRAVRSVSPFWVTPPAAAARVRLGLEGAEVRAHPEGRVILSNGAGAMAQVRVGWGEIRSQYDAFLAANPNANVPSDRVNVWSRMRCWLQREGYTRAFDAVCQYGATTVPSGRGVCWGFLVPCGLGKRAAFTFVLTLAEGANAARLRVTRVSAGTEDVGARVRIVFRPDIEWRSFHATTKAHGLEDLFAAKTTPTEDGFVFAPYEGSFALSVKGGAYHHEPQWTYNVPHPEEAARGQEGAGDLYSPGWISADMQIDDTVEFVGNYCEAQVRTWGLDQFPAVTSLPIDEAMRGAMDLFIVRRDALKTVIAGYPWFLDWGRDTFIFLRGMIADGRLSDAVKILKAFAAFEENGTLPNIIYGETAGNRDTVDAQLWFIRCVEEAHGEKNELLMRTCESIVDHYVTGTPNGIHVDPDSALVWSPSHFTWMDTNYPACTPRVGYPVEIQALWISALRFLGRTEMAAKATESVKRLFAWEHGYRDCLAAPNGEIAARAVGEDTIRPNQLFLITLGVLDDAAILEATEELLVPGGIRSLNADHPLYRGRYEGDEDTRRKPAYHNGTVWAWPFPLYAEALALTKRATRETALSLLAGAVDALNSGCLCQISEIADGDAPHAQKGCVAQAWSVSEMLRVWLKLSQS